MQIPAPHILKKVVSHFLILENESPVSRCYRLSPDAHAGIVFCYKDPFAQNNSVLPPAFVYGQITRFHDLIAAGSTGVLVIVLHPYALHWLTGIPAHQLTDQLVNLSDIFGVQATQLEEQVILSPNYQHRLKLIEQFLLRRFQRSPDQVSSIQQMLDEVYHHHGWIQVTEWTKALHLTERSLERKFKDQVGLSPKQFLRTIRFRHLLKTMQQEPGNTFTQIAYDSGYYDQPHFNREFKTLTGITPKQYMTETRLLALNFMQLAQ